MDHIKRKILLLTIGNSILEDDSSFFVHWILSLLSVHINYLEYVVLALRGKDDMKQRVFKKRTCLGVDFFLNDVAFHIHFRMSKTTFENLLTVVGNQLKNISLRVSVQHQLLMCLWILATPDSFRSVGENFGYSMATVHDSYVRIITILYQLSSQFIKWPEKNKLIRMQESIRKKYGFPGIAGYIDGTYINIKAPEEPVRYFNRKKQPALILQGVCDQHLEFTDIYFGEVGSLHDSRVYKRSPLSNCILQQPTQMVGSAGHLLGDSAYTLTETMMTPYRDNGHLLDEEIHYNYVHAKLRNSIERSFGLLKSKWRRLKYLDASVFDYIKKHVVTCCMLHNFILQQQDQFIDTDIDLQENCVKYADTDSSVQSKLYIETTCARNKRNRIAALLYEKDFCT